ncbi:MAG: hypothetical protein K1000chlam3_00574 [Chlamydiae bacterium]|nr:hypothetical protein [Chlamydiota bacterium]
MMRFKIYKFFLATLLFFAVERFCRWQTDGFRYTKAACRHPYPFSYQTKTLPENLQQSFYFLGSGVQFYAFLGEDRKTILKLFKHHHMGLSTDLAKKLLPKAIATPLICAREKRMSHLFESAKIAIEKLPDQTGVYFLHIDKTSTCLGKTHIYDKLGIAHEIDLDQTDFVLQKKAEPTSEHLDRLFQGGQIKEAILSMKKLLALIEDRSRLGIKNKDGNVLENCGFLGECPVELDIGSFIYRVQSTNPDPHAKAALRATLQLLGWVKKNYPENLQLCREELLYEKIL